MAPAVVVGGIALEVLIAQEVLNNLVGALVGQTLSAILAPEFALLQQESWKVQLHPGQLAQVGLPLDPATLASAVVRGQRGIERALDDASRQGVEGSDFHTLVATAGQPLPLQLATEAWRRQIIPEKGPADGVSLEQAIRESDLKNKYIDTVKKLQFQLPPIGVVIEGWLRAQITPEKALEWAYKQGVDAETATLMFKAAGRPPSPQELLELWRRGVIPETGTGGDSLSVDQGYLETDLKDKWLPIWKKLRLYVPPPRTVTALLREGAIDDKQAAAWFADAGLDAEGVAAYIHSAHHQRTAATKELAKAEILTLWVNKLVSDAQATEFLSKEGYAPETITYEMEVADFRERTRQLNAVLGRIRSLYIAHKIDKTAAMAALTDLGLEPLSRDAQVAAWEVAAQNNVAILTPAQIGGLVSLGWLSFRDGVGLLEGHGYSPIDAQLYLVEHLKMRPGDPNPPEGLTLQ